MNEPEGGMGRTPSEGKASDASPVNASSDNIETLWDEIGVHIGPRKARSNLNSPIIFADDDVIESGHRDLYTSG